MKAQQFTGPVQAKGVEDTAFYRYHVLVSADDVGGHPGRLGVTAAEFHLANAAYMQKAVREAKVHTSWIDEDQEYGRAVSRFVEQTLCGAAASRWLRSFVPFQRRAASVGMLNSLAQLVVKLSAPGVTDVYQGNELWDLSLVDPDNRRDVDFGGRRQMLAALLPLVASVEGGGAGAPGVRDLLDHWEDGRIKMFATACGLRFRRRHPEVLLEGEYAAIESAGPGADHVVAFARRHASGTLLAVVPRLAAALTADTHAMPVGREAWSTTRIRIPGRLAAGRYRHMLTGESLEPGVEDDGAWLAVADVSQTSPIALLWAPGDARFA